MAVYKLTMEGLAQYLSDTEFKIKPNKIVSSTGTRTNGDSTYKISIKEISSNPVIPKLNCFLDENTDRLQVQVCLPEYKYSVKTDELSKAYQSSNGLRYDFNTMPKSFTYTITKLPLNDFEDIQEVADGLLEAIEDAITEEINKFRNSVHDWTFENIEATIKYSAFPSANHEEDDLYEEKDLSSSKQFIPFR